MMTIAEQMLHELPSEAQMTRRLLARIPDEKLTWAPSNDVHTIGWNASHLVEILSWVPGIVGGSEWDIAPVGGEPFVMAEATSTAELLRMFDANLAAVIESLQGVSDDVMGTEWSLKMGGQTLFTMKKGDCIRKWVFSHSAHHRGVLSAYLKLAGVQFPSIFEE